MLKILSAVLLVLSLTGCFAPDESKTPILFALCKVEVKEPTTCKLARIVDGISWAKYPSRTLRSPALREPMAHSNFSNPPLGATGLLSLNELDLASSNFAGRLKPEVLDAIANANDAKSLGYDVGYHFGGITGEEVGACFRGTGKVEFIICIKEI